VFTDAFVGSYREAKLSLSPEAWKASWDPIPWTQLMLWRSPLGSQPVLEATAAKMGLVYWNREPFRLDAALVRRTHTVIGNLALPMVVAIEHENELGGFIEEIAKLSHVRCPLKVGITYAVAAASDRPVDARGAQAAIDEAIGKVAALHESKEDPDSEYLFLLGVESSAYNLDWYAHAYHVADGPEAGSWDRL
jgi:hypothetical protein